MRHDPVITEMSTPGVWGVFCQACSHIAGDYVYPCTENKWSAIPPEVLKQV